MLLALNAEGDAISIHLQFTFSLSRSWRLLELVKRIITVAFAILLLLAMVGAAAQPIIQGIAALTHGNYSTGSTETLTPSGTASSQQGPGVFPTTAKHPIGYLGCSNSADAVMGYYMNPNMGLLWKPYATGGGSLDMWTAPTSQYWTKFDQQVQTYGPPSVVWVNLCERAARPLTFNDVQQTISILRRHAPAATYYISPLNTYSPVGICKLTGPKGVQDTMNLANQAVANSLALLGPILGPLTSQALNGDLCHPNAEGEKLLGSQLSSFFDSRPPAPTQPTSNSAQLTISENCLALDGSAIYYTRKEASSITGWVG